jgi:hypothetical protein
MAKKIIRWFKPKKHSGWKKTQSSTTRRRNLMATTDKRKSMHDRYLEAGRRIQALANVSQDSPTEKKARADAKYFFRKL